MARKEIGGVMDDNNLNKVNHNFTELYQGKQDLSKRVDKIVDEVSDEAFDKVVDSAKLDWSQMVDTFDDLPTSAKSGETRGVKADSKVYRYDGSKWVEIYEINLNPIAEVNDRLTTQLAEEAQRRRQDINRLDDKKADKTYVDGEIEMLDGKKADKGALAQIEQSKRDKDVEIEMKDLAQEVKESMTGGSVSVVGDDAVGTSNLKNYSVTRDKMHKDFMVNSPWITGESETNDLNYIFDEGNYMVGRTVINNPFNGAAYLTVSRHKTSEGSVLINVKQTLTHIDDEENLSTLYRMIRYSESEGEIVWITGWEGEGKLNGYVTNKQVTLKTDFNGKIKGQDFIPHIAKKSSFTIEYDGDNLIYPTPYDNNWLEFSQKEYDSLNKRSVGVKYETSSSGHYACHLFSFNVFEFLKNNGDIPADWEVGDARENIKYFNIKWVGRGNSGTRLHYWLRHSGNYSKTTISNSQLPPRELNYPFSYLGSTIAGRQLDDDGFLHILITSDNPSDGGSVYVDTFDVEVNNLVVKKDVLMTDTNVEIYDSGLQAYDATHDRLKVSVEDSTTRKLLEEYIRYERQGAVVETLFKGELDSDEYVNDLYSLYRGEKETRILVSTDQEGFRMIVGAGPFDDVENFYNGTTYPNTFNINDVFTKDNPLHVLPIYRGSIEVDENTTWEQAYQHRQLNDFRISFRNTASEKANVTIKIMRIFK